MLNCIVAFCYHYITLFTYSLNQQYSSCDRAAQEHFKNVLFHNSMFINCRINFAIMCWIIFKVFVRYITHNSCAISVVPSFNSIFLSSTDRRASNLFISVASIYKQCWLILTLFSSANTWSNSIYRFSADITWRWESLSAYCWSIACALMYVTYASYTYDTQNLHPLSCSLSILSVILKT